MRAAALNYALRASVSLATQIAGIFVSGAVRWGRRVPGLSAWWGAGCRGRRVPALQHWS